jgi:putative transposase
LRPFPTYNEHDVIHDVDLFVEWMELMPRRPRLVVPGIPMHITQRGVNRAAIFVDAGDRQRYLDLLEEVSKSYDLPVHAYALMGNHVHLLLTANESDTLAHGMRLLNQRYVSGFNRRHLRTGTLWESRFRSSLVESERYLLSVYRYIELNPVRAAIVDSAEKFCWSSAATNLGLGHDPCVTPHPVYQSLGVSVESRVQVYREWLNAGINVTELASIRSHMLQERALGSPRFQAMMEKTLNRPVGLRPRGRPRKDHASRQHSCDQTDSNA